MIAHVHGQQSDLGRLRHMSASNVAEALPFLNDARANVREVAAVGLASLTSTSEPHLDEYDADDRSRAVACLPSAGPRESVPPFISKLYDILSHSNVPTDTIRWGANGDTIVVTDQERFATEVLPRYFKHNNIRSFVRQLNSYRFQRCRPAADEMGEHGRLEFYLPTFRAGRKDLLCYCTRGNVPQRLPPGMSWSPLPLHVEARASTASAPAPISLPDDTLALSKELISVQEAIAMLDAQVNRQASEMQGRVGMLIDLLGLRPPPPNVPAEPFPAEPAPRPRHGPQMGSRHAAPPHATTPHATTPHAPQPPIMALADLPPSADLGSQPCTMGS